MKLHNGHPGKIQLKTEHTPFLSNILSGPSQGCGEVKGAYPAWLAGQLMRTAPAVFKTPSWQAQHWFDGLGMVYSIDLAVNGEVTWKQKLLSSEFARATRSGDRVRYGGFGTRADRSLFEMLRHPAPKATDNTNVNIVQMGDDWVAMTETPLQLKIDSGTLETRGLVHYEDALPGDMMMTAHPQWDFQRRKLVNVGTVMGRKTELVMYEQDPTTLKRVEIGRHAVQRLPYTHSFGLSPNFGVLLLHPLEVHPLKLLFSRKSFIEHFEWTPANGARLVVIDRRSGSQEVFETESMFVFHTVNTFEEGNEVVMDVLAYDDGEAIIRELTIDSLNESFPNLQAKLKRIRMRKGQPRAIVETLTEKVGFEFPQINSRICSGHRNRFTWGAALSPKTNGYNSDIVKVSNETGDVIRFSDDDFVFGEPIFVGAPSSEIEQDGVLLTIGSSPSQARSKLAILHAENLLPLAEVLLPFPIPLGFHGNFKRLRT